jgi:hypothetical protein
MWDHSGGPRNWGAHHVRLRTVRLRTKEGCPSCSAGTDELSAGFLEHLHSRDTNLSMVSRAPLTKLEQWQAKNAGTLRVSLPGTDFNYDLGVTIDESVTLASTTSEPRPSSRQGGRRLLRLAPALRDDRAELLPAGRRTRFSHLFAVRPGTRVHRGPLLLPRPHRPRPQEDWEEPKGRPEFARAAVPGVLS